MEKPLTLLLKSRFFFRQVDFGPASHIHRVESVTLGAPLPLDGGPKMVSSFNSPSTRLKKPTKNQPGKLTFNVAGWKKWTRIEAVFRIENGDFPTSYVSLPEDRPTQLLW